MRYAGETEVTAQFSDITQTYLAETDLSHRKTLGQYFTPRNLREQLLSQLPPIKGASVLDPACGTGEFLQSAKNYFPGCKLFGWEIDAKLARLSRKAVPSAKITRTDSLWKDLRQQFEFVIGNPPYFEFKPDSTLREKYADVISGRANIFAMFVKLGLESLKPNGYLAFVIPPSMNNGAYFSGVRNYIMEHANIEYLSIQDSSSLFDQAQQTVMLMVLKKGPNGGSFIFRKNGLTIFTPDPSRLKRAFRGKTTMKELGLEVRTGRIVWNQHREKLSDSRNGTIPLIRAHNITPSGLVLGNSSATAQYIHSSDFDTGPAIVVNRVTGAARNVRLKAALVEPGIKFVGENHVNVIYPPEGMPHKSARKLLERVLTQISSADTIDTMKLVTGNTQISRTELQCLLPLKV